MRNANVIIGLLDKNAFMVDPLSPKQRSERMSRVRGKDTKPEIVVRRLTYSLGYRYRLHDSRLPGRPDLVFAGRRKIIQVHGCFWHRHSDPTCKLARMPKSRVDFWKLKLEENARRDGRTQRELEEGGWRVLTIWECQLKDQNTLASTIKNFLEAE